MIPPEWLFRGIATLGLLGGLGLALTRNVVHGALFLVLALLAVAGLYLALAADFVALVQVLLYGGAVSILILFAMMLTQVREEPETTDNGQQPVALLVSLAAFAALAAAINTTEWPGTTARSLAHIDFDTISAALFTTWAIPFEIVSLVLLAALIGAIVVARQEPQE
ncbi:MAG: NADH-quinone oxidoreductase subunit J [Dehalococcoidia bacterium]|nr:NADH-quinone oxidoreductase subunit J [Dehalococcoidia bacterium]